MIKELLNAKVSENEDIEKRKAEQKKKDIEMIWKNAIASAKPESAKDDRLKGTIKLFVEDRYVSLDDVLKAAKDEGLNVKIGSHVIMSNIEAAFFYFSNNTIEIFSSLSIKF